MRNARDGHCHGTQYLPCSPSNCQRFPARLGSLQKSSEKVLKNFGELGLGRKSHQTWLNPKPACTALHNLDDQARQKHEESARWDILRRIRKVFGLDD